MVAIQPASQDIWASKYQLKTKSGSAVDQTIADTFKRVADALVAVEEASLQEKLRADFIWAMENGAYPAGRVLANAGAEQHKPATSTINCTVAGTIMDSMDDILRKAHESGLTLKGGSGVGYEFSTLRPKGAYVAGAGATTSGPLSFMDIFDKMCATVSSAGGRRGAQMATFDVHHPDVFDFIRAKREDGRLRHFNLSLLITESFIDAVRNDSEWRLSFPARVSEIASDGLDVSNPDQIVFRDFPVTEGYLVNDRGEVACRVYRVVRARDIWDAIMRSTYDFAEPGFIMIDRVNEMNNNWFCENIRASNPCVTADTWVQTSDGPRQVHELVGRPSLVRVNGVDHATGPEGFFRTATKPVVNLMTQEGYAVRLTADHRVLVAVDGKASGSTAWREAGSLRSGDCVVLHDHGDNAGWPGAHTFDQGYLAGLFIGERYSCIAPEMVVHGAHPSAMAVGDVSVFGPDGVASLALPAMQEAFAQPDSFALFLNGLGLNADTRSVSAKMERTSSDFHRGLLRGLFDANGRVEGVDANDVSVRLSLSDLDDLRAVQRMLLRLGIPSGISANRFRSGLRLLSEGRNRSQERTSKAQYELVIRLGSLAKFRSLIGFGHTVKARRLDQSIRNCIGSIAHKRFVATVSSVIADGEEDVFDVQVPGPNAFDANGIYAHNCGEQMLPPNGSCLLGSINLVHFVEDPFTAKAVFNMERFRRVVRIFTRMLDNVVEINGLPLQSQRDELIRKRRHGMGYLGLGSALAMLGHAYGSAEAVALTERITHEMAVEGYRTGLDLAREKGAAPIMMEDFIVTTAMLAKRPEMVADGYKVGDSVKGAILHARYSRYMQLLASVAPNLVDDLAQVGCRFTHHTSIAPTGTLALSIGNNVSNGIEPSFAHHYFRNVIREGKKTKEKMDVFSHELLAYRHFVNPQAMPLASGGSDALPACFTTSEDVSVRQHVDMQAAAQRWVDASISKTINVPTAIAYEDFKDVYLYAHEMDLKGCTTFRFNPSAFQGVLVQKKDLDNTVYEFTLEDGSKVKFKGGDEIAYDGEIHTAANLFDALKEGTYGRL